MRSPDELSNLDGVGRAVGFVYTAHFANKIMVAGDASKPFRDASQTSSNVAERLR